MLLERSSMVDLVPNLVRHGKVERCRNGWPSNHVVERSSNGWPSTPVKLNVVVMVGLVRHEIERSSYGWQRMQR